MIQPSATPHDECKIKLATLNDKETLTAILLGFLANTLFKSGLILTIGGRHLALLTLPGFAAVAVGAVVGWWLCSSQP